MQSWKFTELSLRGAYLIDSFFAPDIRGGFCKDYSSDIFRNNGINYDLSEVFYTYSKKGVIRALHFQRIKQQPKLVRCVKGHVFDVIVDLRKTSPTYKSWLGFDLTEDNHKEILVPAYFGHGYLVLEDSIVSYKCAEKFYSEFDGGIRFDDNQLNIQWPYEKIGGKSNLIISEKDLTLPSFRDFEKEEF